MPDNLGPENLQGCSGDVQKQHLQVSDSHDQNSAHDSPGRLVQIYPQKQKKPVFKPLKLYQMPLGTRVCIDTKRFDGDTPGSYSKGKPAKLFGTLVKKGKAGVMYVDYDIGGISKLLIALDSPDAGWSQ